MNPPEIRAGLDSVIIKTDEGSPIVIAMGIEGAVWVKTVSEPGFADMLVQLGFDKRLVPHVTSLETK